MGGAGEGADAVARADAVALAKAELRARVRARRAARSGSALAQAAAGLARQWAARAGDGGGGLVAAYAAYGGEPDLGLVRGQLRAAGVTVWLPVVRGTELGWAVDDGAALARGGERAMPEPVGPLVGVGAGALRDADVSVLFLPALAVGADGIRLGQGGGYYDRLLAGLAPYPIGPLRVAVCYDEELLAAAAVPADPHDLAARVDAVLTPGNFVVTAWQ